MLSVKVTGKERPMNVYAASVALLWSTALRAPSAPSRAAARDGSGTPHPKHASRHWWQRGRRE
jgi:hypothetical protein